MIGSDAAPIVREAVPADGTALVAIIAAIDHETKFLGEPGQNVPWADRAEAHLRALAETGSVYFLAEHEGSPIGYLGAFAGPFRSARGSLFIAHVGLREGWRGCGIGGRLFAAVEDWARARGVHRLHLRVDVENAHGQALYRKRGFAVEGRLADSFRIDGQPREMLPMGKPIAGDDWRPVDDVDPPPPSPGRDRSALAVRSLLPEDAGRFQRFERRLIGEPGIFLKSPEEIAADLTVVADQIRDAPGPPWTRALVAIDGAGDIVAQGNLWRERFSRMAHIAGLQVNVLPGWRGSGLGRDLVERLIAAAAVDGVARIEVGLQSSNLRGRRFARANGFVEEAVLRRFSRFGERYADRVLLARRTG